MPFALMQRRLDLPDVEALRRAFHGVSGMTQADAAPVARDAFGVLIRQLDHAEAVELQSSLAREGVETDVVDHADLPELPAPKWFRRVAVRESGFVGCDPYDRELSLPWESLAVVSGGLVRNTEFVRPRTPSAGGMDWTESAAASAYPWYDLGVAAGFVPGQPLGKVQSTVSPSAQERQVWRWTADLILEGGSVRFSLRPDQLHFIDVPPGAGGAGNRESAFLELLRSVASRARRAVLNRVAYSLREGHAETISYPSRNAYQEELLWLLWRLRRSERAK